MKNKKELTAEQLALRRKRQKNDIIRFFAKLIMIVTIGIVTFCFIFGIAIVPDDDMRPIMRGGDIVLYYRNFSALRQNDIVVYRQSESLHCGRVVAMAGDTVAVTSEETLIINGSTMSEQDIFYKTPAYENGITYPIILNNDEYFLLGDYRQNAKDSRYYGAISVNDITGKIITIIRRNNL